MTKIVGVDIKGNIRKPHMRNRWVNSVLHPGSVTYVSYSDDDWGCTYLISRDSLFKLICTYPYQYFAVPGDRILVYNEQNKLIASYDMVKSGTTTFIIYIKGKEFHYKRVYLKEP